MLSPLVFFLLDPNRLTHSDHMNALGKAVQYRIYSLFHTLIQLGTSNISGAIHIAVRTLLSSFLAISFHVFFSLLSLPVFL
jgi:hypothetical protein